MAASSRHVGRHVQKNGRLLINNFEHLWGHRSFGWTSALRQQAAETYKEPTEDIVIPKKKTWSKEAVLETLASTVKNDPTAYHYNFTDDSYLSPRTSSEFKLYFQCQDTGRAAAKYFINKNPTFFAKDFAEPHIPSLMPEKLTLCLEDVSEEALNEQISLRKVAAAVDMYDRLVQAGTAVSMETVHDLLDLICLYCDKEPEQEADPEPEPRKRRRVKFPTPLADVKFAWKENNNAERIFNMLPERDVRCYSALIQGMVKYKASAKAFELYKDMMNNRLDPDVTIFNALLTAVVDVKETSVDRCNLILELLGQMAAQKVQPNLQTFNCSLKSLKSCGLVARRKSLMFLSEMKALGITPSLATYDHIIAIYHRIVPTGLNTSDLLREVLSKLNGKSITYQDIGDVMFFSTAMKLCCDNKDLQLGYEVHKLLEVGDNWRLLGDPFQQSIYYGRLFYLVCMMENIDEVLKWYRRFIPSVFYPNAVGMMGLLQALDSEGHLHLLPTIWKDIHLMRHDSSSALVEEVLKLMARDKHSPEVQESFAECALDVKKVFTRDPSEGPTLEWTNTCLSNLTTVLLQANRIREAWDMLKIFKSTNRVPSEALLDDFLTACQSNGAPQRAVDAVQLSASFFLPSTANLATRALAEFNLTEEQRAVLSELESSGE